MDQQSRVAKVVCVSNHKGGVGKTTTACNIGAGLAQRGKKILLVDMDPQANLSLCFAIKSPDVNIYRVLMTDLDIEKAIYTIYENLDIVPASLDLAGAEIELSSEQGRELILREELSSILNRYDYIIIDCGPNLGLLTTNSLTAADEVIIPVEASYFSVKGLTKLSSIIEKVKRRLNPGLKDKRVLITQYDKRKVIHRDIANEIEKHYAKEMFKTKVRNNITLAEAPAKGVDIFQYNGSSNGAKDYGDLCDEIIAADSVLKA